MNLRLSHCRRALALLLCALTLMSLLPSAAFAGQVDDYHDPAAHWMTSSNRTNQLDINSVVTQETLHCYICGTDTPFTVWRVPEYTRDGASALMRNVQFSDGTTVDGSGTGAVNDGTPGVDAYYTGFHWTKSSCNMCGSFNANHDSGDYCFSKNVYKLYDCVSCGLVEKRNYVSAIGHAYQSVVIRAADCETEGKILDICRNCGDVKETVTPKGEHHYRTYNIASTCTAPGYTVRECKVCGERHIENITEPAGHSFVSYATPPTCTTGGHILHICSVCGESFIDNYLPATGHSMDDGRALTPAVCDHDGVMEYTCVTCGHTVREPIPDTGHTPGPAATCTDPQLCAICGAVLAQANGHSFRSAVVLPTCLEMGHTDYVCADCGFAYDGDYVNPLGHNHIGVITAPTCTERGFNRPDMHGKRFHYLHLFPLRRCVHG